MASDEMFLENLEEYVCDENKVVTYKWLSTTLGVHVNQAKQMLYTFVDQQRNKKDDKNLSVIYFVSGTKKSENGQLVHRCCVVPEEKLDSFKSTLSSTTSCHIYSVQKARLKDTNALYITDYEKRKENLTDYHKHSAIRCPSATVRSEEEILKLRGKAIEETRIGSTEKPASSKLVNGHGKVETSKSKPAQKSAIAGMFASAGKKIEKKQTSPELKTEGKTETKDKVGKSSASSAPAKTKGGVMTFFSKQPDVKTDSAVQSEVQSVKSEVQSEDHTKRSEASKSTGSRTTKTATNKKASPANKSENKGKGKKSRRVEESDDEPQKKKRRRIRDDMFESSSEEEDMELEPESPVPSPPPREPTPPREPSPEPESPIPEKKDAKFSSDKPTSGEKRRKRKRKLVPKTFMDEDGFMVTEKVWESDSTDASEVEDVPKDPPKTKTKQPTEKVGKKKPSPEKKAVSPAKGSSKQASLMSFFKKK